MSHNFNPSFSPPQGSYSTEPYFNMSYVEDEACQGCAPMPLHNQPHFNQVPGIRNPIYHREYGTYSLMPSADPFTDYAFSFEAPRSLMRPPPLFPMPPSPISIASPPHVMYPNPPPLPTPGGIPDPRFLIPFEFPQHRPHFFLPPPPQMVFASQVPSLHPGPSGPGDLVNVANGFNHQVGLLLYASCVLQTKFGHPASATCLVPTWDGNLSCVPPAPSPWSFTSNSTVSSTSFTSHGFITTRPSWPPVDASFRRPERPDGVIS